MTNNELLLSVQRNLEICEDFISNDEKYQTVLRFLKLSNQIWTDLLVEWAVDNERWNEYNQLKSKLQSEFGIMANEDDK